MAKKSQLDRAIDHKVAILLAAKVELIAQQQLKPRAKRPRVVAPVERPA